MKTLGILEFSFVFGGREYCIWLNIMPGFSPLIFSHLDLDKMGLNYQSLYKLIERQEDGYCETVDMRNGVPYLVFSSGGYFSDSELRAMHRNLGHPSIEKQMKVIENADLEYLPRGTRQQLADLVRICKPCQLKQGRPRRFLFSIRDPAIREFNHVLQIDIVKLTDGNVLHAIDIGTRFQQGMFISKMDAATAWRGIRRCWINLFAGAPDYIHADAGSNFTSEDFKRCADAMGIVVKIAPTEGHDRVGIVERSHAVLKSVYAKLRINLPKMAKEDRLSMTFRAINYAPNAEIGVCPATLVLGVYPKIPGAGHRGSMAQRANIIRESTKLVMKMKARRTLRDSMRTRNSPSLAEIEKCSVLSLGHCKQPTRVHLFP